VSASVIRRIRPAWRRPLARRVIGAGLLTALVCWYLGADLWQAILVGTVAAVTAAALAIGAALEVAEIRWRSGDRIGREGSRSDISVLSWGLRGSWGRVDPRVVTRVREIARMRLSSRDLDLNSEADRPEIERLIGRRAYLTLAAGGRRPPRLRALLTCLDVLDSLATKETP
jgi:hypothetical protein